MSVATSAPSHLETKWVHHAHWDGNNNHNYGNLRNPYQRSSIAWPRWKFVPCFLLFVLPWIPCKYRQWQLNQQKAEYLSFKDQQSSLVQEIRKVTEEIRVLRHESEVLTKMNEEAFKEMKKNGGAALNLDDELYLELEAVEEGYIQRIDKLQKQIQDFSQKQVVDRYVYKILHAVPCCVLYCLPLVP